MSRILSTRSGLGERPLEPFLFGLGARFPHVRLQIEQRSPACRWHYLTSLSIRVVWQRRAPTSWVAPGALLFSLARSPITRRAAPSTRSRLFRALVSYVADGSPQVRGSARVSCS